MSEVDFSGVNKVTDISEHSLKTKVILPSVLKLFKNKNFATPFPPFQTRSLPFHNPVLELGVVAGGRQDGNLV
jgi:hypothetical protein